MPDEPRFTVTLEEKPRSPFWQARIYLAGEGGRERRWSTRIRIGSGADRRQSKRAATRAAEEHAATFAAGAVAPPSVDQRARLRSVIDRLLATKEADGRRARAIESLESCLVGVERHFGASRDVREIRRADLEGFKAELRQNGKAATTINNHLVAVRQVLKHACLVDELIESVPTVANVQIDRAGHGRALTADEVQALVDAVARATLPEALKVSVPRLEQLRVEARHRLLFAVNTALRRAEVLAARFSWVDEAALLLVVPAAAVKGGRARAPVPLNQVALQVVQERQQLHAQRRDRTNDRIFRDDRRIEVLCNAAAALAGLGRVRRHDLRHTRATHLHAAGGSLVEVADALGHKTLEMVRRYGHSLEARQRDLAHQVQLGASDPGCDPGAKRSRGGIRSDHARRGRARSGRR